jgi:hypothetical protein
MQATLDLTVDYRTYRLARILSENLSLGELREVSPKWQDTAPAADRTQASPEQVEQRHLAPQSRTQAEAAVNAPADPASSIREVVEQVFQSGFLSREQESLINELLLRGRYTEGELEILDQLIEKLLSHEVEAEQLTLTRSA